MKKVVIFLLSAVMVMALSGCTVYDDLLTEDHVVIPMYDGGLALSFAKSNNMVETLPVNLTSEQADELFGSIEVYGANLALPMRLSDLPAGFEMDYEFDEDDLIQVSESLYVLSRDIYISAGEETVRVFSADILMDGKREEDLKNGYIVSYVIIGLRDAVSSVQIKGVRVGALYDEELTEAYGEGYCYPGTLSGETSQYVVRIYYDGERMLQILYCGEENENGEIDIEKTIKESAVLSITMTDFSLYEIMYRIAEGGI